MVFHLNPGEKIMRLEKDELYGWHVEIKVRRDRYYDYERWENITNKEAAELMKSGLRGTYTWSKKWQIHRRRVKKSDFGGVF